MNQDQEKKLNTHVQTEEQILQFWEDSQIFQKSLDKTRGKEPYVFYDGPPFATGTPHYGHILASAVKDAIPRYWTMKGRYVRRRWGWDCHGLPIEQIVEAKLGISGKKQIEQMGVDKFNETCRANVLSYVEEWGKTVRRIARFVEFEDSYKTMDSTYMESVWWALKQIWEKGLIYEGRKVLLYCPRCETPVSNFEVAMDNSYDNVDEDSVYARALVDLKNAAGHEKILPEHLAGNVYVLFWTTTPWTLPGNVALAVGPNIDYVLLKPQDSADFYILEKSKAEILFNNPEIISEFKGSDLAGASYKKIFDLPALQSDQSFKIYAADFVTSEDGTGIVHTAVVYGEDDYNLGLKEGLPVVQMLTAQGNFNSVAPEFLQGKFYKDAEPGIIAALEVAGNLFKKEAYSHSVPFCWRCGTRLFYNAIPAWFVNIQLIKPRLRELNQQSINWYPEHLKNGRFDKGLENAPDWNISRNRYWATPLPFWKCQSKSCGRTVCVGSLEELAEKASNYKEVYDSADINEVDLHRPYIDRIVLQCGVCGNEMRRVEEVIDCWVESGSMPFAEFHYPFENKEVFEQRFPAQFVAEYISQTRAWFYVMHVLSTILFDKAPFENVVTTGVILAEDGQKMSKSKKNYPDPWEVLNEFGADALRFYLLTSPIMQAENLNFSKRDLDEIYKKVILILSNVHSFLRMYTTETFGEALPQSANPLDIWILAMLHQLQFETTKNLDGYDTVRAWKPVTKFINELSTWYVRRSRDRIKEGGEDSKSALAVLAHVLIELSKLIAPIMPYISESIYKDLTGKESVHLADWNQAQGYKPLSAEELNILAKMQTVREIVELGLAARKEANVKLRQPLEYLAYSIQAKEGQSAQPLPEPLEKILGEELNVKAVQFSEELAELPETKFKQGNGLAALLSLKITPELAEEGLARELERQVQDLRKKMGLKVGDLIDLYYETKDLQLEMALVSKFDRKKTFVMQIKKELEVEPDEEIQAEIEGKIIWLGIVKV